MKESKDSLPGLVIEASNNTGCSFLQSHINLCDGYLLRLEYNNSYSQKQLLTLNKFSNGALTLLAYSYDESQWDYTWLHLKLERINDTIYGYISTNDYFDKEGISYYIGSPKTNIGGKIGFGAKLTKFDTYFDNVWLEVNNTVGLQYEYREYFENQNWMSSSFWENADNWKEFTETRGIAGIVNNPLILNSILFVIILILIVIIVFLFRSMHNNSFNNK